MLRSSSELPPIVPVLRALLQALGLSPEALPHLRSLAPSLLLDLLAALLGQPLPLPKLSPQVGRTSASDEDRHAVEAVKLAIGVLSFSVDVDMTSVDPWRAVQRHTAELLVLGRATVLLAVEKGWDGTADHWEGKSLRRLDRRRPVVAPATPRGYRPFETPPPPDLPLPLLPDFSPVRHSTPPPASPLAALLPFPPLLPTSPTAFDGSQALHRQASLPRTPPRRQPVRAEEPRSLPSPSLERDPAGAEQKDTVTRLTAPEAWGRRVDEERHALLESLMSLGP